MLVATIQENTLTPIFYITLIYWNLFALEKSKLIACKIMRPRDKTLLCAVSNDKGIAPIFAPKKYSVFTSLIKLSDEYNQIGTIEQKTITEIIDNDLQGNCPTVLSIDIEGKDYEAIKGIDFERHSPKFILIECWNDLNIDTILQSKIHRKLTENEYNLISWTIKILELNYITITLIRLSIHPPSHIKRSLDFNFTSL